MKLDQDVLYNVETILKNTNEEELFCLFGEFLNRLKEKNGVLSLESKANLNWIVLDKTKGEIIREMKK